MITAQSISLDPGMHLILNFSFKTPVIQGISDLFSAIKNLF